MACKIQNSCYIVLLLISYCLCSEYSIRSDEYRLPKNVVPSKYKIQLETRIEPVFKFTGDVSIEVAVTEETQRITMHSYLLDFADGNVAVNEKSGPPVPVTSVTFNDTFQFVHIDLEIALTKNKIYIIEIIGFQGKLRDDMSGYYKSSYKTPDGETRWLATTQFEPTHARSAFPCFDEPAMKATFEISLVHSEKLMAISNMPMIGSPVKEANGMVRTSFKKSVRMSTYLVAFVVSDFGYIENEHVPVNYRVYSVPHAIDQAQYALKMTPKILAELENLTKIPYKLKKLDQIAIPDFAAGAMENWGIVTYREMYLLYNEKKSTTKSKEEILTIIAHELTHQWFGNLVTCDWWEHTWLNEGFAAYFQHYIPSLVEPKWRLLDRYVVDVTQGIMVVDALITSRPMSHPVGSPSEISAVFDGISYQKASSVIHMMMHAFDVNNFVKGLHKYLSDNSFQTGLPHKLFDALASEHAGATELPNDATLQDIFLSWSSQAGFPLVTVKRDYETGSMTLEQKRFFATKPLKEDNTKWWIPISYTTSKDLNFTETKPSHWMNRKGEPLTITSEHKDGWIILNKQNTGYFRVNYDEKNWNNIAEILKSPKFNVIDVLNRAQLLDDALNLAKVGTIGYELALELVSYLNQETDYLPWAAAARDLQFIDSMIDGTESYPKYQAFILHLVDKVYNQLGFEESSNDQHIDVFSRISALTWACRMDHKECIQKSHERLLKHMEDPENEANKIPPNLHNVIYCTALKQGGEKEWEFLWNEYVKSELSSESTILLNALGCTRHEKLLKGYLDKTIEEDSKIRDQDKFIAMHSVIKSSDAGMVVALNFMKENFELIMKHYTSLNALAKVIELMGSEVSSDVQYNLLNEILDKYENKFSNSLKQSAKTAKETMADNREWWENNLEKVAIWLENHKLNNSLQIRSNIFLIIILAISANVFTQRVMSHL